LADDDARDIASYRLLIAIEAALALCYHVCARQLQGVPEDYAGCFAKLEQSKLIPSDLAQRLQRMARFRNLLVHVYWTVDYEKVFEVLEHHTQDLRTFAKAVAALL
jgi:uncharacterized protein YutE (UPF0331/DUF86 family)